MAATSAGAEANAKVGAGTAHPRIVPWFSRFVLILVMTVLGLIARKFIGNPAGAASASDIMLGSPLAFTNMRASFGAFPLGGAVFVLLCLTSRQRRVTGLIFVAVLMAAVLAVRLLGVLADGTLSQSLPVIVAETVLLLLSLAALTAESFWATLASVPPSAAHQD
jgi:Domain of unknown function (DUF4345)